MNKFRSLGCAVLVVASVPFAVVACMAPADEPAGERVGRARAATTSGTASATASASPTTTATVVAVLYNCTGRCFRKGQETEYPISYTSCNTSDVRALAECNDTCRDAQENYAWGTGDSCTPASPLQTCTP